MNKFLNVQERTLLNNVLCRKVSWIGYILRRNCLLNGQITEVKWVGRTQLLDDLRNRRRKLKIGKVGNDILSIKHEVEIQVIFHTSMDLTISSINNNNNNNNNNNVFWDPRRIWFIVKMFKVQESLISISLIIASAIAYIHVCFH